MDKYIGKKLEGRYEILEVIGFGGMAVVYKANDILEKREVAVKILKDEFLESEDFKRRFRNESKAISLLSNDAIVKVLDVNFSDNIQYIVMELIDGITLKEYIERQGVVSWKEAVHFSIQILRGLQHAHDNGIVHRDIKPQNIMLLQDGTIKVMDFGIARFARENGKTVTDKAIGSVQYISPEQARGENTDEKSDIYSVGVILYEMLTGVVPFDGESAVSIAVKQMQKQPQNPTEINNSIPIGLEEIVLRSMQKEPSLRYLTASEMLRDIDEFKNNPSVIFEYKYFNQDGSTQYFDKVGVKDMAKKKSQPKKKSYILNVLAGITAACVILAIVSVFFLLRSLEQKTDELILPNFVGMTVDEAQKSVKDVKFVIEEETQSAEYDRGIIIQQTPSDKVKVKVGSEVSLVVSSGFETFTMPNYILEDGVIAKSKLEDKGIEVQVVNRLDDSVPSGSIIATDPKEGVEVKKNDRVILYISMGSADLPILVPNIIGKTEVEARSELIKQKLGIGKIEIVGSDKPAGTIIEQTPKQGQKVEKNTKIDVKISDGVPPVIESPKDSMDVVLSFQNDAADKEFKFDIIINDQFAGSRIINPSKTKAMNIELTLQDGMINGIADYYNTNYVKLMLGSEVFVEYAVYFDNKTIDILLSPRHDLLVQF